MFSFFGRNIWFHLFLPAAAPGSCGGRLPVPIFFHGGGFILFSPSSKQCDDVCRWLRREVPAAVVSVNYRLSPEHRCPVAYDDGLEVLRFIASHPLDEEGSAPLLREFFHAADLPNYFIVDDNSGGNIDHHVARKWSIGEATPVHGRVALAGLVAIHPFFGGEERLDYEIRHVGTPMVNTKWTDWMWRAFLSEGAGRDHQAASPEGATAGVGEGFPSAIAITGAPDELLW